MKPTLLTLVDSVTSYAMHGRQIAQDLGLPVRAIRMWHPKWAPKIAYGRWQRADGKAGNGWELLLHPPGFCPTKGKRTVYFSMHESTRLPRMAIELFNRCEAVIVPCEWNVCNFSAQGVKNVRQVPLGVNDAVFRYRGHPEAINDLCVFGCAGRMASGGQRKGINEVIEAFFQAFPFQPDVRLKVKVWPDCPVLATTDPRVEVTAAYLTEEQMAQWLAGIHCFVSAAKGEGWGLLQHQAMAVGRPVICANFGGIREFFHAACNYEVPYALGQATGNYQGLWACPSVEAMVERMREVYRDRQTAIVKGAMAAGTVKHLTWRNHSERLAAVLKEVGAIEESSKLQTPTPRETPKPKPQARLRWRPMKNPPRLELPNVTLWACCWSADRENLDRTLRVLRFCQKRFKFGATVLFSYLNPEESEFYSYDVEVMRIPELTPDGWNVFHLKSAAIELMKTGKLYFLSVHADGFPLAPELWREEFFHYSYVGAPWKDGLVGNGGFCFESYVMLKAKALDVPYPPTPSEASDTYVCRTHRKLLEDQGIRFAPTEVAVEFSTEQTGRFFPSFGFHGRRDQPEKMALGWELIEESEK